MEKLQHYTDEAVEVLRENIGRNLDWYYSGKGTQPIPKGLERPVRESNFPAASIARILQVPDQRPSQADSENAIRIYSALRQLTPKVASMEKLWSWLAHNEGAEYIRKRWLQERPEKDDDAVRAVQNHFFAKGNRGVIRDNGLSRLWWLGHIAYRADEENPRLFLDIVLHRQDIRSALIERPSVAMNHTILRGIYRVMKGEWATEEKNAHLFKRKEFRSWMVGLNRRGGIVLLDALPEGALDDVLRGEAAAAGAWPTI